jgi:DNA replication protein DnaC
MQGWANQAGMKGKAESATPPGPGPKPEPGECTRCQGPAEAELIPRRLRKPPEWVVPNLCGACAEALESTQIQSEEQRRFKRRWEASGLPDSARDWDWDKAERWAKGIKKDPEDFKLWQTAFHTCRYWAGNGVLYLYGPEGSGKTTLGFLVCISALEAQGPPPLWLTTSALFDLIDESYAAGSPARAMEARAMEAGLLVLDEIAGPDTDRPGKRQRASLFKIINHREAHRLPTVITSNHTPADLVTVFRDRHDRTLARLVADGGVKVAGKSFRLIRAERQDW